MISAQCECTVNVSGLSNIRRMKQGGPATRSVSLLVGLDPGVISRDASGVFRFLHAAVFRTPWFLSLPRCLNLLVDHMSCSPPGAPSARDALEPLGYRMLSWLFALPEAVILYFSCTLSATSVYLRRLVHPAERAKPLKSSKTTAEGVVSCIFCSKQGVAKFDPPSYSLEPDQEGTCARAYVANRDLGCGNL